MTEASFASLGPRLLARKGGAKPAMRPQAAALPGEIAQATAAEGDPLEDLGWNDMGAEDGLNESVEAPAETSADIVPISAKAPKAPPRASKKVGKKKSIRAAKRAAFTLRLDSDRHLKLRLASTMQGVSAQALVTKALDRMLTEIEDLDALAERMKRH
ncbi:MAG: hypothetical protein AAGL10_11110 [Pseudomonadota bacterium]